MEGNHNMVKIAEIVGNKKMAKIIDIEGLPGDPSTDAPMGKIRCKHCGTFFSLRGKKAALLIKKSGGKTISQVTCPQCGKKISIEE